MDGTAWKRLAIVLGLTWCAGAACLASYEWVTHRVGVFVEMSLPVGTIVSQDKATLPDGQVIDLAPYIDTRTAGPWEIRWSDQPRTVELHVRAIVLAIALLVPLAAWLALELVAKLDGWIVHSRGRNDHEQALLRDSAR